ncbi:MAG: ZIP family metal transporter [Candidatus Omnitrophica bacterium]|nr:ZIP family metal transporter [Candidatus Omnitrophota bacterium]
MLSYLYNLKPLYQALIAGTFTWFITLIGASVVFLNKKPNRKIFDSVLGFAGGVMLAASFFSLIVPSIEYSKNLSLPLWFPVSSGILAGTLFLLLLDKIIPHLHINSKIEDREGIKTEFPIYFLLVFAITLHNIPEGIAVGVSFGSLKYNKSFENFLSSLSLAIGIGIQNFPEGFAVSLPLSSSGISKSKSFILGQLSGFVEPVFAIIGAFFVTYFSKILPYALSFAAGAMIYVVIEEVIPETQKVGNTDLATLSFIFGFIIMTILDISI